MFPQNYDKKGLGGPGLAAKNIAVRKCRLHLLGPGYGPRPLSPRANPTVIQLLAQAAEEMGQKPVKICLPIISFLNHRSQTLARVSQVAISV